MTGLPHGRVKPAPQPKPPSRLLGQGRASLCRPPVLRRGLTPLAASRRWRALRVEIGAGGGHRERRRGWFTKRCFEMPIERRIIGQCDATVDLRSPCGELYGVIDWESNPVLSVPFAMSVFIRDLP
jgi:hypothetical protein